MIETSREWNTITKLLRENSGQPRISFPAKELWKTECELKMFFRWRLRATKERKKLNPERSGLQRAFLTKVSGKNMSKSE